MARFCTLLPSFALFLVIALVSTRSGAEAKALPEMKVTLAASTFTSEALKELQPLADQVSRIVDELIPGEPQDYPHDGIVCFEAPARWTTPEFLKAGFSSPPVTLNGAHVYDEPVEAKNNAVRIAVTGVKAPDKWRFAFQLSHELAHVKMGTRTDNYLDETFAVALSYEVLRRLGYEGYLLICEGTDLHKLPSAPQQALASGQWDEAKAYWLIQAKTQNKRIDDRTFQTLGAVLILWQKDAPHWGELFNAGSENTCSSSAPVNTFQVCDPDLSKMRHQNSLLKRLGLS